MQDGDLISRSALLEKMKRYGLGEHSLIERAFADGFYAVIDTAPAVDALVLPCKPRQTVWLIDDRFVGRGRERWPIIKCRVNLPLGRYESSGG